MLKKTPYLAFLVFLGLWSPAAGADVQDAVLGARGEIYVTQYRPYGMLFPNGTAAAPADEVLALDIIQPNGTVERQLVPGTKDTKVDSKPTLFYEDGSRTVFLVWENKLGDIYSVLTLAAFTDGSGWTGPIELTGRRRFSPLVAPQIAITRDSYQDKAPDGTSDVKHRTFVHVLWEEELKINEYATFYTPVILEEGTYLKSHALYNLNELIPADVPATSFETTPALVQSPVIQRGGTERAVVAAFASAETRRVYSVEIGVLPEELGRLAGKTRAAIIELGGKYSPGNLRSLADQIKAYVLAQETDFQPEIIQAIAERVHSQILSSNNGPGLTAVADSTGAVIIDLGARLTGRSRRSGEASTKTVEIPRDGAAASTPPHLLQFRLLSSRPAPRVGSTELKIFSSPNGEDLLIAWIEGDRVRYRESVPGGWTEPRENKLSGDINKDRAFDILEQRIRNR